VDSFVGLVVVVVEDAGAVPLEFELVEVEFFFLLSPLLFSFLLNGKKLLPIWKQKQSCANANNIITT